MKTITVRELLASNDIVDLLPDSIPQVTQADAEYHADVRHEWIELNQIEAERNRRFHQDAISSVIRDLPANAMILELGSGVGYDSAQLVRSEAKFGCLVVSEISRTLLEHAKSNIPTHSAVRYCVMTATDIPLDSVSVDRVFTIAALHHVPALNKALCEIDRITAPSARIIFAIEPNRFWSAVMIFLRPLYRALMPGKGHSAADEDAEGFRIADFRSMAITYGWSIESLKPVWLLTGFLHLGLEFVYRAMRLKRRIKAPTIERAFLAIDTAIFWLPLTRHIAWHYTVVFSKHDIR